MDKKTKVLTTLNYSFRAEFQEDGQVRLKHLGVYIMANFPLRFTKNQSRDKTHDLVKYTLIERKYWMKKNAQKETKKTWQIGSQLWSFWCTLKTHLDQEIVSLLFSANVATLMHYNLAVSDAQAQSLLRAKRWTTFRAYCTWKWAMANDDPSQSKFSRLGSLQRLLRAHSKRLWEVPVPEYSLRWRTNPARDLQLYVGFVLTAIQAPEDKVTPLIAVEKGDRFIYASIRKHASLRHRPHLELRTSEQRAQLMLTIEYLRRGEFVPDDTLEGWSFGNSQYTPRVLWGLMEQESTRFLLRFVRVSQIVGQLNPLHVAVLGGQRATRRALAEGDQHKLVEDVISDAICKRYECNTLPKMRRKITNTQILQWIANKAPQLLKLRTAHVHNRDVQYQYWSRVDEVRVEDLMDGNGVVNTQLSVDRVFENVAERVVHGLLRTCPWTEVPHIDVQQVQGVPVWNLCTVDDIMAEYRTMKHCINTYALQILSGQYLAFHIQDQSREGATAGYRVELVDDRLQLYLDQVHGFFNTSVSGPTYQLAQDLRGILVQDHAQQIRDTYKQRAGTAPILDYWD